MRAPVFLAHTAPLFSAGVALTIASAAGGRFVVGSGTEWTILAAMVMAAIFAASASETAGLVDYQVSRKRWLLSAAGVATTVSLLAALVIGLVSNFIQSTNGWYGGYDSFLVTTGTMSMSDANGEQYWIDDAGVGIWTILLTAAMLVIVMAMACAIGIALGALIAWGGLRMMLLAVVASLALYAGAIVALAASGVTIAAPYPGVPLLCLPIGCAAVAVTMWALQKMAR